MSPSRARPRHPLRAALLAAAGLAAAAPTAGDIGGCGQPAEVLDDEKFFAQKARIECDRCSDCGVQTDRCVAACAGPDPDASFPDACVPLAHDGEVCLRALAAASCGEIERYLADRGATAPTECLFCPEEP